MNEREISVSSSTLSSSFLNTDRMLIWRGITGFDVGASEEEEEDNDEFTNSGSVCTEYVGRSPFKNSSDAPKSQARRSAVCSCSDARLRETSETSVDEEFSSDSSE